MAKLNITYNGLSVNCPVDIDFGLSDHEVRRYAAELVATGEIRGLDLPNRGRGRFARSGFDRHVVDRFETRQGGQRIYLRPKVPFA